MEYERAWILNTREKGSHMNSKTVSKKGATSTANSKQSINEISRNKGEIKRPPSQLSGSSTTIPLIKLAHKFPVRGNTRFKRFMSHRWLDPIQPTESTYIYLFIYFRLPNIIAYIYLFTLLKSRPDLLWLSFRGAVKEVPEICSAYRPNGQMRGLFWVSGRAPGSASDDKWFPKPER